MLLVFSTHAFFLSACVLETREFFLYPDLVGALRANANQDSLKRDEYRAGDQSDCLNHPGGDFLTGRRRVWRLGYSTMFFLFVAFTVVCLLTVALFLPETKGKTLEEIEAHFEAA